MKTLLGAVLLTLAGAALAFGDFEDNSTNVKQIGIQVQKAKAKASAGGGSVELNEAPIPKPEENAAIAPDPSAPPPSAQCRYGWSVTGAAIPFGAGITASEWDEICGLWLAAQQTTGEAKKEAAAAAFCLTMKKAQVKSPVCVAWENGQGMTNPPVELNDMNKASISFGGVGASARN